MTDEPLAVLDAFEGHAYAVSFAPDGQHLLVGGFGGLIRVYDTTSLQEVGQYSHHDKSTNHIAFAPDGQSFAVSSSDRTISIWQSDADAPSAILKGHRNTVMGLSWSRDGHRLASAATDNTIRIWSPDDADAKPEILKSPYRIVSYAEFLDGDEQIVSAGGGDEALVWNPESGDVMATLPGHGKSARSMQLSDDSKTLMTQDFEGLVRIWSTADWLVSATHDIGSKAPRSVRLSPDGSRLAVMEERRVRLIALPSLEQEAEFALPIKGVHLASFSPDGNLLAVTAADGKARVWDISR